MGFEPSDIQREIDTKNVKCPEYRKLCDELWLLLDIDAATPSRFIELTEKALEAAYPSAFDRAFVLVRFGNAYHELKLSSLAVDKSGQARF